MKEGTTGSADSYSVDVEEAANLFAAAGVPRSERTIQRYCERKHLACEFFDATTGEKYLITRESIDRRIEELRQMLEGARHVATEPTPSAGSADPHRRKVEVSDGLHDEIETLKEEKKELELHVRDLEISNRGKDYALGLAERSQANLIEKVETSSHRIGVLESQLKQLAAPTRASAGSGDASKIVSDPNQKVIDVEVDGEPGGEKSTSSPQVEVGEQGTP
jgi:hypothetical protein